MEIGPECGVFRKCLVFFIVFVGSARSHCTDNISKGCIMVVISLEVMFDGITPACVVLDNWYGL